MAFLLDVDGLPLLTAGAALLACYCSLDRCLPKAGKQEISAAFKAGLMREMQAMSKTQGAEDPVLKRGEFMAMFMRHGVPEAPPDTSRGRLWPWIVDVWRGGLQNGSNQGNTNLFYICVKAVSKYFN